MWFPRFAEGETGEAKREKYRSAEGEIHGVMNDCGTRVHEKNMRKVQVETV